VRGREGKAEKVATPLTLFLPLEGEDDAAEQLRCIRWGDARSLDPRNKSEDDREGAI